MKKSFLLGLAAMVLPWTAWAEGDTEQNPKLNEFVVTLTDDFEQSDEIEYKGVATVGVTVKYYTKGTTEDAVENTLTKDTHYTVSYTYKQTQEATESPVTEIKNAGIYTVTVTGKGNFATDAPVSKTFIITRKALTLDTNIAVSDAKLQYGTPEGAELEISKFVTLTTANGVVSDEEGKEGEEEADALKCLSISNAANTGDNVGDAALIKVVAAEQNTSTNYEYKGSQIIFKVDVEKKVLTLSLKKTEETPVYNGQVTQVSELVQGLDFVEGDDVQAKYTIKKDEVDTDEIKAAGTYTITVTLDGANKDNYSIEYAGESEALTYTVGRKAITITQTVEELKKVYDGKPVSETDLQDCFEITGIVESDDITVTMKTSNATKDVVNAGELVRISPFVNGTQQIQSTNFKAPETNWASAPEVLKNYYIDGKLVEFTIAKRPVKYYFKGGEKKYDGKVVETPSYEVKVIEEEGTGFIVGEDIENADGFDTEPKAKFADFEDDVTEAKNANNYALVEDSNEEITFKNNSNNYDAQFVKTEDVNVEDAVNVNVYVISKADFTARPLDKTVNYAKTEEEAEEMEAELNDYLTITIAKTTYEGGSTEGKNLVRTSVDGTLVNEMNNIIKQLGETLTIPEDIDLTKVGEYEIGFSVEAEDVSAQNWNITLIPGKLYVKGESTITLDGGDEPETEIADVLRIYNGATVNEVTVKNLKSLTNAGFKNDGRWYTLVLPFDVTVREISNAFGYALVNVPDVTNTDHNKIVFKLEMTETIKANTLIAFRVDNTLDSDEDINLAKGVKFANKKIEAPAEDHEWLHDDANNYFIGVYSEQLIKEENQFYLNPAQKQWRKASAMENRVKPEIYGEVGMVMNAMNGYVEFSEGADLAKVRVFVQEADGTATSINVVTSEPIRNAAEGWYTVSGVKLNAEPTEKGIYINNGKKVVIK